MIKPFNFFLVGFQTIEENNKTVKPLAPFTKDYQRIVYEAFLDYETGETKKGLHYFKSLSRTIMQYANHPESKFDGNVGILERRHVHSDSVIYIGKEANNIDEQELDVEKPQVFINEKWVAKEVVNLSQKVAEEWGIDRKTFQKTKKAIREALEKGEKINLFTPTRKRLLEHLYL